MRIHCPLCFAEFPAADVNVAADVAYCKHCREASKVSELINEGNESSFDLSNVPAGVAFSETHDGWELASTTRNWAAWFIVPFTVVWSGLTLTGIYYIQIAEGRFDPGRSLFGLPFLIGTIFLVGMCLMMMLGQVRISVSDGQGSIFRGLGRFGWRRKFNWSSVHQIEEGQRYVGAHGSNQWLIVMHGAEVTRLGHLVTESRRRYILHALRGLLKARRVDDRKL